MPWYILLPACIAVAIGAGFAWHALRARMDVRRALAVHGLPREPNAFWSRLKDRLTAQPVLWLALITFAIVAAIKPIKIGLLIWGICKLAAFAFTGDWCDARIFPDAQPDNLKGIEQGTAWKRKGLIVAAAIIAGALLA